MPPPRATWKGHLRISLVSCPVRLYTAVSSTKEVSFNLLHPKTHNRINMKPVDPELGIVERSELVKGYPLGDGRYIELGDEDFEKVRIESSDTMVVERFVPAADVDNLYLDTPNYLAPDGPVAEETFRVVREAMTRSGTAAISRHVRASREVPVLIAPRGKGLSVTTLRAGAEVRKPEAYFEGIKDDPPNEEMVDLALVLIDRLKGAFDPSQFRDRYQDALLEVIKAKMAGVEPVIAAAPQKAQFVDLMEALRRSVEDSPRPPAKSRKREPAAEEKKAPSGKRKTAGKK